MLLASSVWKTMLKDTLSLMWNILIFSRSNFTAVAMLELSLSYRKKLATNLGRRHHLEVTEGCCIASTNLHTLGCEVLASLPSWDQILDMLFADRWCDHSLTGFVSSKCLNNPYSSLLKLSAFSVEISYFNGYVV